MVGPNARLSLSRQPVTAHSRKTVMRAQATPLRHAQAVASARPPASILQIQVRDVALDRVDRDLQACCDLTIGLAVREQAKDLDLAR